MFRRSALVHCLVQVFSAQTQFATFQLFRWAAKVLHRSTLSRLVLVGGWVGLKALSVIGRECKLYDLVHCAAQLSVIVKLELLIGGDRDTSHR